ncbi:hypothetical protein CPB86DRAFT_791508 [Serendipita vermifera]|nr:hypothetical protein CPB86DRAFT_791508 [Serendipita vermifera]
MGTSTVWQLERLCFCLMILFVGMVIFSKYRTLVTYCAPPQQSDKGVAKRTATDNKHPTKAGFDPLYPIR